VRLAVIGVQPEDPLCTDRYAKQETPLSYYMAWHGIEKYNIIKSHAMAKISRVAWYDVAQRGMT
jgi:hypothetical protein